MIKDTRKGFTLLETFVAVTILVVAILGPFELARRSIASATVSQNRITAFYLAQEALEFIKNKRDNNYFAHVPWLQDLSSCMSADGCSIDVQNNNPANQIITCSGTCPKIRFSENYGYNYNLGGDETIFTRTVKIDQNVGGTTADDEAKVAVIVSWQDRFSSKTITLEENIYNWR